MHGRAQIAPNTTREIDEAKWMKKQKSRLKGMEQEKGRESDRKKKWKRWFVGRWRRRIQLLKNSLILSVGATVKKVHSIPFMRPCCSSQRTLNGHNFNTFPSRPATTGKIHYFDAQQKTTKTPADQLSPADTESLRRTLTQKCLFYLWPVPGGGRKIHVKFVTAQWRWWFFLLLTLIPIVFCMHISSLAIVNWIELRASTKIFFSIRVCVCECLGLSSLPALNTEYGERRQPTK